MSSASSFHGEYDMCGDLHFRLKVLSSVYMLSALVCSMSANIILDIASVIQNVFLTHDQQR